MDDPETTMTAPGQDLFLIELGDGDNARYAVAERFLTIDPGQSAIGVPWRELTLLFKGRTLRAVPLPGSRNSRMRDSGVGTEPGVGTNNVEVNLVKIEKSRD